MNNCLQVYHFGMAVQQTRKKYWPGRPTFLKELCEWQYSVLYTELLYISYRTSKAGSVFTVYLSLPLAFFLYITSMHITEEKFPKLTQFIFCCFWVETINYLNSGYPLICYSPGNQNVFSPHVIQRRTFIKKFYLFYLFFSKMNPMDWVEICPAIMLVSHIMLLWQCSLRL